MRDFYIKNFDPKLHHNLRVMALQHDVALRDLVTVILRGACKSSLSNAATIALKQESEKRSAELSETLRARHRAAPRKRVVKAKRVKKTPVPDVAEPEVVTIGK